MYFRDGILARPTLSRSETHKETEGTEYKIKCRNHTKDTLVEEILLESGVRV